jgi:subtilisin-like proprotein convertase family protein
MKKMFFMAKKFPPAGIFLCLWTTIASAQTGTNYNFTFSANAAVPDGNPSGIALNTNLTGVNGSIASLTVSLDISGGYNGDLYAYLRGPNGGFSVLLNRTGVTAGNSLGYDDSGFDVTFADSAAGNIHLYQEPTYNLNGGGQLTGDWQPDGRAIDPLSNPSLFDATQPTSLLNSFGGTDANGKWTLFLADLSGGGQSIIVNWGLNLETVPEPSACALLGIGIFLGARKWIVRSF